MYYFQLSFASIAGCRLLPWETLSSYLEYFMVTSVMVPFIFFVYIYPRECQQSYTRVCSWTIIKQWIYSWKSLGDIPFYTTLDMSPGLRILVTFNLNLVSTGCYVFRGSATGQHHLSSMWDMLIDMEPWSPSFIFCMAKLLTLPTLMSINFF